MSMKLFIDACQYGDYISGHRNHASTVLLVMEMLEREDLIIEEIRDALDQIKEKELDNIKLIGNFLHALNFIDEILSEEKELVIDIFETLKGVNFIEIQDLLLSLYDSSYAFNEVKEIIKQLPLKCTWLEKQREKILQNHEGGQ